MEKKLGNTTRSVITLSLSIVTILQLILEVVTNGVLTKYYAIVLAIILSVGSSWISYPRFLQIFVAKTKENYPNLSIVGIFRLKRLNQTQNAILVLIASLLIYLLLPYLVKASINPLIIYILLSCAILVLTNQLVFDYRIRKGLYGRNQWEARQIISFILQNADNIDFTDGGSLKRIITVEDLEEIRESIYPPLPQGVLPIQTRGLQ